jgi:hypothetical protein
LRVNSDIKLLRRILQNFLTNAFRYAKGPVLLGVRRRGELCLEVWDRGPGIPLKTSRKSFSKSSNAWTATRPAPKKAWAWAWRLLTACAECSGTRLQVRSWPGKGSVFSVSVPLAKAQTSVQVQATPRKGPAVERRPGAVRGQRRQHPDRHAQPVDAAGAARSGPHAIAKNAPPCSMKACARNWCWWITTWTTARQVPN